MMFACCSTSNASPGQAEDVQSHLNIRHRVASEEEPPPRRALGLGSLAARASLTVWSSRFCSSPEGGGSRSPSRIARVGWVECRAKLITAYFVSLKPLPTRG